MKYNLLIGVVLACAAGLAQAGGFGRETTGGAGGEVVTVNGADPDAANTFRNYVQDTRTPYIVQVEGTINLESVSGRRVRIASNKTVRGVIGTGPTIIGEVGFMNGHSNIIVERLTITNPHGWGEGDGLQVKEDIENVLITKCTLFDCDDGLIDITRRSDNITVSWCKFYFTQPGDRNNRVSLIGAGDNHTSDEGKFHITFHHNWFSTNCWQRIPSVRYGRVHIYNNFYDCPGNLYGVRSRIKAECLIENNFFRQINNPYYVYIAGESPADYGKIAASGNIFEDCTGTIHPGDDQVFSPPYDYTLYPASIVPALVQWGAGADGRDGYPPHWMYGGMYGDFDRSGMVDIYDFAVFALYWLATEDIENADFNGDGIVDEYELLLFIENWMRDVIPPAVPENLSALGQDGQVTLTWDENTVDYDLDGYFVYRATSPDGDYVRLNASPAPTAGYVDTDVVNGTMYYYVVSAVDLSGNESETSNIASALPTINRPAAPQSLWALGQNGQVTLSWAQNTEDDLDGYYVYRTTMWNENYVRLNDVPLPTTEYVDNNVVNGTMYYYIVSAVNFDQRESSASVYGCARPNFGQPSLTLQEDALGFCGVEGIIDYSKHTGFTGAGFSDALNQTGTGINWKVNIAEAGVYTFRWRYANGSSTNRIARLLINGTQAVSSIDFPTTGNWNTWTETSIDLALTAGVKDIRLEGTLSESLANIDYLKLIGAAPEAVACP